VPDAEPPAARADAAGAGPSLREEQVRQTRAALVAAGRALFGSRGFAATSVDDLAAEARVTTGALYHHFPTKTALFETVFEELHLEVLAASMTAAEGATSELDLLARGIDSFLDSSLQPDVQRIMVIDAPAVLGLARYIELDDRHALGAITNTLKAAQAMGELQADDPETLATLLMGALTRGSMLIATSADPAATRDQVSATMRRLIGTD
jgi:AcrR family transcriptional regulator